MVRVQAKLEPGVNFAPKAMVVLAKEVRGDWLRTYENKWLPIRLKGFGMVLRAVQPGKGWKALKTKRGLLALVGKVSGGAERRWCHWRSDRNIG